MSDLFNVFKAKASIKGGKKASKDVCGGTGGTKIKVYSICIEGEKDDTEIWEIKIR